MLAPVYQPAAPAIPDNANAVPVYEQPPPASRGSSANGPSYRPPTSSRSDRYSTRTGLGLRSMRSNPEALAYAIGTYGIARTEYDA